ncbi:unnamed protein product [Gongylonema pulchrum]|uniref:DNA helicase n=1 Tax=Gongylonema pulchrum TaxID=637853 RepID=A0A183DT35_9BILA|nr:unnamed protein product [Gongylonema pulchrum]
MFDTGEQNVQLVMQRSAIKYQNVKFGLPKSSRPIINVTIAQKSIERHPRPNHAVAYNSTGLPLEFKGFKQILSQPYCCQRPVRNIRPNAWVVLIKLTRPRRTTAVKLTIECNPCGGRVVTVVDQLSGRTATLLCSKQALNNCARYKLQHFKLYYSRNDRGTQKVYNTNSVLPPGTQLSDSYGVTFVLSKQWNPIYAVLPSQVEIITCQIHITRGVSSADNPDLDFVEGPLRAAVALSGARQGLIVIGDFETLFRSSYWRELLESFNDKIIIVQATGIT